MSSMFNYPIETDEAIAFWASDHKCNNAQAFIAFSLDEDNFRELAKRHGYTRSWRDRMWSAFGSLVNQPDMQGAGFSFKEMETPYWECMPLLSTSGVSAPLFQAQSANMIVDLAKTSSVDLFFQWVGEVDVEWYKDGILIPGATGEFYTAPITSEDDLGVFTTIARNSEGEVTSPGITVAIKASRPTISLQPLSVFLEEGDTAAFTVAGDNYSKIQWLHNGVIVLGEEGTSYSYVTDSNSARDRINAVLINGAGRTTSTSVYVDLDVQYPIVTQDPESLPLVKSLQQFTLSSDGINALSYQWSVRTGNAFADIDGANGKVLTTSYDATSQANSIAVSYRVAYIGKTSTAYSRVATVYVDNEVVPGPLPHISKQPVNASPNAGTDAVFTTEATNDSDTLFYLWQYRKLGNSRWFAGDGIGSGEDTTTFTVPTTYDLVDHEIQCRVRGAEDTTEYEVVTNTVLLSVQTKSATISKSPANTTVEDGGIATFSITASHAQSSELFYQWQVDGSDIAGATSDELSFIATESDSGAVYRCVVRPYAVDSEIGEIISSSATLIVTSETNEGMVWSNQWEWN